MKAKQSLKQLAKKGDVKSARLLAREVVRTNKQKNRLHMSKARLGSIQMQMQHQLCESSSHLIVERVSLTHALVPFNLLTCIHLTVQLWSK